MHELSITQHLLDLALSQAKSRKITSVNLRIGQFSQEREENIRFYWRDLAKGTPGEGAILHFRHASVEMRCLACGGTFDFEGGESICAHCHGNDEQPPAAAEVQLELIEMA